MYTFEFITRANWGAWKRLFVFSPVSLRKLGRRGEVLKEWAMVRKWFVGAWVHGESRGMVGNSLGRLGEGLGKVWWMFGDALGRPVDALGCIIITHDGWIIITPLARCVFTVNLPNNQKAVEIWLTSSWEAMPSAVLTLDTLIQPRGRPSEMCDLGCQLPPSALRSNERLRNGCPTTKCSANYPPPHQVRRNKID